MTATKLTFATMMSTAALSQQSRPCSGRITQHRQQAVSPVVASCRSQPVAALLVPCLVHAPFRGTQVRHSLSTASRPRSRLGAAGLRVCAEQSYVMIKPDGVQRGLVGEVISRFERKGFKLVALKMQTATQGLAEEHYKELSAKPFFKDLVDYIISGPVICMVWEGEGVVASFRKLVGATNPLSAEPGTIRGDFGRVTGRNIVHASDSPDNGVREAGLWFGDDRLQDWTVSNSPWLVE